MLYVSIEVFVGGIGEISEEYSKPNYYIVDNKTDDFKLEKAFRGFLRRHDIGLILITKEAAEKIPIVLQEYKGVDPAVLVRTQLNPKRNVSN